MLGTAQAEDFTAGFVMDNMESLERHAYVSGIIEGLAYARYVDDGRNPDMGMRCIYEWYYDDELTALNEIYDTFRKLPDYTPGAVVAALTEVECGES